MICALLTFVIIMGISGGLALLVRRRMEETTAFSVFLMIMVLYVAGLVTGTLKTGVYICIGLGIGGAGYLLWCAFKKPKDVKDLFLTPGFFFYTLMFIWVWWINRHRLLSAWDEFSHWGLVVRNMMYFDYFGNHPDSNVIFRGYPPATALWQYFVGKLGGGFREENLYRAMGWLITAMYLPVVKKIDRDRWVYGLMCVGMLIFLPSVFAESYIILLYVDSILGILFFYLLTIGFTGERISGYDCVHYGLTLAVLCLTKASGAFLALVAFAVILIGNLAIDWKEKTRRKSCILLWGSSLLGILFGKYSWSLFLRATGTNVAWSTKSVTGQNLAALLKGEGQPYQYEVVRNFVKAVWSKPIRSYLFKFPHMGFSAAAVLLLIVAVKICGNENRRKMIVYGLGCLVGHVGYTLGMLILYIFTYSQYEAVALASFDRYFSTYFIGLFGFLLSSILFCMGDKSKKACIVTVVAGACIMLLVVPAEEIGKFTVMAPWHANRTVKIREEYAAVDQYLDKINYKEGRVWIISQANDGIDKCVLEYLMVPVDANGWAWSLGEPYYEGDVWTVDYDCDTWRQMLQDDGFAYVYLHKVDDLFTDDYGSAFDDATAIKGGCMYRVDKRDGLPVLVRM